MSVKGGRLWSSPSEHQRFVLLVFGAALLSRLFVLQSWWCLDDWGQLARAAGHLAQPEGVSARVLSQQWWWAMVWPVLGFNPVAHGLVRMLLHGLASVGVVTIARRLNVSPLGGLVAGLIFAASPVAFTVLYWASGIQELLAGVLAIWALERWLATDTKAVVLAMVLALFSVLSKESGLGLPLVFIGTMIFSDGLYSQQKRLRLATVVILILVVGWEIELVRNHFETGQGEPYQLGSLRVVLLNLGQFGVWLGIPWPVFPPLVPWPQAGWGVLFWGAWMIWGVWVWIRGSKFVAATFVAAMLSLGPALPLLKQSKPYMAYTAVAALALVLGGLVQESWFRTHRRNISWGLAMLAIGFSLTAMNLRLKTTDPVVRGTVLARETADLIKDGLKSGRGDSCRQVAVFQQPLRPGTVQEADQRGPNGVRSSSRHASLQGVDGLRLLLPKMKDVYWVNDITHLPSSSFVFCETGDTLEAWGPCADALLYAAMIDVMVGSRDRAASELLRASEWNVQVTGFAYDPQLLKISPAKFRRKAGDFIGWLHTGVDSRKFSQTQKAQMSDLLQKLLTKLEV